MLQECIGSNGSELMGRGGRDDRGRAVSEAEKE